MKHSPPSRRSPSSAITSSANASSATVSNPTVLRHTGPNRPARALAVLLVALFPLAGGWLAMLAGLLWWANAPIVIGWHPRAVLTASMEPSLSPGDVILVRRVEDPDALPLERLVVVRDPGRASGSYVHRIVRRDGHGRIVTKGDANRDEDHPAVENSQVIGEVRLVVPVIGLPVVWLRQNVPALIGSALVTWAALGYVLHVLRSARGGEQDDARVPGRAADPPSSGPSSGPPSTPSSISDPEPEPAVDPEEVPA